jgi:hypothetical protein
MDRVFTQTFNLQPRSSEELQAVVRRFEAKWRQRRRAHPFAGLAV